MFICHPNIKIDKMKKFFGILFIAFAFTACSSDDDANNVTPSVAGTWKMTAFNMENAYDLNGDGNASINLMDETGCYQNELMVFNADSSGRITSNSYADINLDLVMGTTDEYEYSIECEFDTEVTPFTYIYTDNQVKIIVDDMEVNATISGNTLTYVIPSGMFFEVEDPVSGTVTIVEDVTFIYTKQ